MKYQTVFDIIALPKMILLVFIYGLMITGFYWLVIQALKLLVTIGNG